MHAPCDITNTLPSPIHTHNTHSILKQEPDNLRFQSREKVFEDEATVGDQEIENDDIVYCTFRRGEGDSWEDIDITTTGDAQASEASEKK